jgi:hypothetical protein
MREVLTSGKCFAEPSGPRCALHVDVYTQGGNALSLLAGAKGWGNGHLEVALSIIMRPRVILFAHKVSHEFCVNYKYHLPASSGAASSGCTCQLSLPWAALARRVGRT